MPYFKRRRYYKRKRFYRTAGGKFKRYSRKKSRKSKRYYPSKTVINTPVKDRTFVKLKYNVHYVITSASSVRSWVWRGNDLGDPDFTSTGAQPAWYDEFFNQYNRLICHGSKFKITAYSSDGEPIQMTVVPTTDATLDTVTYNGAVSLSMAKYAKTKSLTGDTNAQLKTIKHMMSTKKIIGVRDLDYKQHTQKQVFAVGPGLTDDDAKWYWIAAFQTWDGLNFSAGTRFMVQITYYCEYYNMINYTYS